MGRRRIAGVYYASNHSGNWEIYSRVPGAAQSEIVMQREFDQFPVAVAPDGTLAFQESNTVTGDDIWFLPPGGVPSPALTGPGTDAMCDFSADGRWLAFASDASGRSEIYVKAVDRDSRRLPVSTDGGQVPTWSPKGDRLYYRQGAEMMVADVTGRDPLVFGRPRPLFEGGWDLPAGKYLERNYAVAPDGEHFVMIRHEPGEAIPDRVNIVLNWFDELQRLGPDGAGSPTMIGRTLAHYRITAALGAGGMGEVWRATDTKLGREVALKVLPAEMAESQERLDRFRREATMLAALDHPGVVGVYSVEESDGLHFLTMQLVEGEPLDRLIPEVGMDLDRILEIGAAIAEALAAAHRQGHHPPRSQTGQRHGRLRWARQGPGFRARQDRRTTGRRTAEFRDGDRPSHARRCGHGHRALCCLSRSRAVRSTSRPISFHLARCCTRWRRGSARSKDSPPLSLPPRFCATHRGHSKMFGVICRAGWSK